MDIRRANVYGGSNEVIAVMPKPRCSVTAAMTGTTSIGSLTGTWAALRSAASAEPP